MSKEIEDQLLRSTVRIVLCDADKKVERILGTGFWVTPQFLLTCNHVVEGISDEKLFIQEYQYLTVLKTPKKCQVFKSRKTEGGEDMALLKIEALETDSHQVALLAEKSVVGRNDELICWGYIDGPIHKIERAVCLLEQNIEQQNFFGYILKEGDIIPGYSGCPVLNTATGKVIGLVRMQKKGGGAMVISMYTVFRWLQEEQIDLIQQNITFHREYTYWSRLLPEEKKPEYWSAAPPFLPREYKNRDAYLKEINQILRLERNRVFLYGMRGLGKTTIAADYCHQFLRYYHFFAWCFCGQGIKQGMVKDIVYEELGLSFDREERELFEFNYRKLLHKMQNLKGKGLLVLDGVDDPGKLEEIPVLKNWDIIISTKLNSVQKTGEAIKVGVLRPEIAKKLFFDYYELEKTSPFIDPLLEMIGYHTLSIELLAKNLQSLDEPTANIEWLYGKICEGGILSPPASDVDTAYTHADGEKNFYKIIQRIFSFVENLSDDELDYLLVFSVFPSTFVSLEKICELLDVAPRTIDNEDYRALSSCLKNLFNKGWLERKDDNDKEYRLHQLIGESIRSIYEPNYQEKYWDLGRLLLLKLDYSWDNFELLEYFRFVEAYIEALSVKDIGEIEGELCLAYLFALMEIGEFEKALKIGAKGLEVLEALESERVGALLEDLIVCCEALYDQDSRLNYQKKLMEFNRSGI